MGFGFLSKKRDKKQDYASGWLICLTVVLLLFIVWTVSSVYEIGQSVSWLGSEASSGFEMAEFERGCEILSEVYGCSEEAVSRVEPSYSGQHTFGPLDNWNFLNVCKGYLNNPLATPKDCINACWRCSGIAPGSSCVTDEDCYLLLGDTSRCVLLESGSGLCTYKE
ncbi:MAG: hypothetical protein JW727_04600 [Candidatus Aenigmarchaeota archaeon]|nr:hypothetical protein [Candidatus Aenigmarchaeota archaeon]